MNFFARSLPMSSMSPGGRGTPKKVDRTAKLRETQSSIQKRSTPSRSAKTKNSRSMRDAVSATIAATTSHERPRDSSKQARARARVRCHRGCVDGRQLLADVFLQVFRRRRHRKYFLRVEGRRIEPRAAYDQSGASFERSSCPKPVTATSFCPRRLLNRTGNYPDKENIDTNVLRVKETTTLKANVVSTPKRHVSLRRVAHCGACVPRGC